MREMSYTNRRLRHVAGIFVLLLGREAAGQGLDFAGPVRVGSEDERYLRAIQLLGAAPAYPWSLQPFSAPEMARMTSSAAAHPWKARFPAADSLQRSRRFTVRRPEATAFFNSTTAFRLDNGPVWTGRGLTVAARGGVAVAWGRLRLELAPIVFYAQNAAFDLAPTGGVGLAAFRDPRFPTAIDLPQRFGDKPYSRLDPGESSLSLALPGVALGISTAAQRWGPGRDAGLVLGPNGGGTPHAYIGTAEPVNLWLFRLHARLEAGQLTQSSVAADFGQSKRAYSGLVATLLPRGAPGLELGVVRWSDLWMPKGGIGLKELLRPFQTGIANNSVGASSPNIQGENQLASAFFRWAPPKSGGEIYGEIYREDWAGDFRSLILRPDDLAAFLIGFQYAMMSESTRLRVVHFELTTGEISSASRLFRGSSAPFPPYLHGDVRQGHTQNGLLLGSPEAYSGSGWKAGYDVYTTDGRHGFTVQRSLRLDYLPAVVNGPVVYPEVEIGVRYELVKFRGGRDYSFSVFPSLDLNHNLKKGNDQFNLALAFGVRGWR